MYSPRDVVFMSRDSLIPQFALNDWRGKESDPLKTARMLADSARFFGSIFGVTLAALVVVALVEIIMHGVAPVRSVPWSIWTFIVMGVATLPCVITCSMWREFKRRENNFGYDLWRLRNVLGSLGELAGLSSEELQKQAKRRLDFMAYQLIQSEDWRDTEPGSLVLGKQVLERRREFGEAFNALDRFELAGAEGWPPFLRAARKELDADRERREAHANERRGKPEPADSFDL
jgi:hypothetical protein